jgi:hypothetical protein
MLVPARLRSQEFRKIKALRSSNFCVVQVLGPQDYSGEIPCYFLSDCYNLLNGGK